MSDQEPGRPDEPEVGAVSASDAELPAAEPEATQPLSPVEPTPAEPAEPVAVEPEPAEPAIAEPVIEPTFTAPEPTPVVGAADATTEHPAGTAQPSGSPYAAPAPIGEERPEVLVGAAFGGGLVAALLLKSLARRKHR